jgi:hypothetical protein
MYGDFARTPYMGDNLVPDTRHGMDFLLGLIGI